MFNENEIEDILTLICFDKRDAAIEYITALKSVKQAFAEIEEEKKFIYDALDKKKRTTRKCACENCINEDECNHECIDNWGRRDDCMAHDYAYYEPIFTEEEGFIF